jgi:hypothetical protein
VSPVVERVIGDLREYFTLQKAAERAANLPNDVRADVAHDLALSIQKREAADILYEAGARAEALPLMRAALELVQRHRELAPYVAAVELPATLPESDDDVQADHLQLYAQLLEAHVAYQRALSGVVLDARARKTTRTLRMLVAFACAFAVVYAVRAHLTRIGLTAEASASWGPKYAPSNAVDGDEATHWLLPDKTTGSLDVKLSPPRKINTVSILDGWDPPAYGVIEYRLEVFMGPQLVFSTDAKLTPGKGTKPAWVDVPVHTDRGVDRVRINVITYHEFGGSIAEVKVH